MEPTAQWRWASARGQSIVEFALVLPLFLLLIVAVLDGGRAIYSVATLAHAVNEGGRMAALPESSANGNATAADIKQAVAHKASGLALGGIPPADVTVSVNAVSTAAAYTQRMTGDRVTVSATYTYRPIVSWVFGRVVVPLRRQTELVVE